jgi:hypothetical protein
VALLHSFVRSVELLNYGIMLILLLSPCILSIFHKFFNLFLVTDFYLVHGLIMSIYNIIIIILHFGNSVSVVLVSFVFILFVI